jgi:hypothetical protein
MKHLIKERKLVSQGEFDGACFLYAIANAFICLANIKPTQDKWDKAIDSLPFKEDFLKGKVGTGRCFEEKINMAEVVSNVLVQFSKSTKSTKFKFKVTLHEKITDKNELCGLISNNSLVLFCFDKEHWVIGSSCNKNKEILHISCSSQLTETSIYNEEDDKIFGRPYNALTKKKNLNCKGTVFSIKRVI